MTGDLMAEDPLCTHTPGTFAAAPLLAIRGVAAAPAININRPRITRTIAWDDDANERMKRVPVFVRGWSSGRSRRSCRKNGIGRVTVEELERIRARMPTPKIFGQA